MRNLFLCLLSVLCFTPVSGQTYKTEPLSTGIRTIQISNNGNWLNPPLMKLNSGEFVQISFDRLGDNSMDRLRYKVIHCNADWTPSSISEIDYLDGFNDNLIEDYAPSAGTTIEYTNFILRVPNDYIRLRISGNYVVLVYEEDNTDNILLSACFSVLDGQIAIAGNMTSNTLIDANREHQQISFDIDHKGMDIRDPFSDLKVFVRQNGRLDNQKSFVKPTIVQASKLLFNQNRDLIFEAGNEYRRFEAVSHRYNGLRIEHTEYRRPYYNTYIVPDMPRLVRYIYDEDQNGRFYIRNSEVNDSDTQGDYFFVHFRLQMEDPILGNVYVNGDFTNDQFIDKYQMQYDYDKREYYLTLLLKQGAYNYMYLTEKGNADFTPKPVEGNHFETENEYEVFVYHRPAGQRYDSFIGYLKIAR